MKRSEIIKMYVWNQDKKKKKQRYVLSQEIDDIAVSVKRLSESKFLEGLILKPSDLEVYTNCKPIPVKQKVLSQKELMLQLTQTGYSPDNTGSFVKKGEPTFFYTMFSCCENAPDDGNVWLDEWLESKQ